MPLQNRVTPFGEIVATAARGLFMGNRGRLHDEPRVLRRQQSSETRWLVCVTEFRGRKRVPMMPGKYTELFFLDEATALAAGHRPCAECRNADYRRFKDLWVRANRAGVESDSLVSAQQIDHQLQEERMNADKSKRSYASACNTLPDGVIVTIAAGENAFLLWKSTLRRWTHAGYDAQHPIEPSMIVNVLTPLSIVRTIAAGYVPIVHPSASGDEH
jgi:hypothetical protein